MVGTPTKIRTPSSPLAREPLSAGPAGRSPDVHSPNKMVRLNGARRGSRYSPPPNPDRPHVVVQAHVNDSPLAFRRKLGPNGTPSTPYLGPRRSPLAVNNQVPQSFSAARPGALYGQSSRVPQDVTRVPSATPAGRPSSMDETNDVPSKPNLTRRLEKKPQVAAYPANANDRHSSYLDRMAAISHPTGDPASPMLETANSATRGKPGMLGSQTPLIAASPALDYSGGLISLRPGTMPPSQQSRLPQTRPSTHAEPSSPMISSSANPAVTAGYPRRVSHSSRGLGVTAADLAEPQSPLISSADLSHARAAAPQRAPAVRIARPPAALPQPPSQMAHMHPHQPSAAEPASPLLDTASSAPVRARGTLPRPGALNMPTVGMARPSSRALPAAIPSSGHTVMRTQTLRRNVESQQQHIHSMMTGVPESPLLDGENVGQWQPSTPNLDGGVHGVNGHLSRMRLADDSPLGHVAGINQGSPR